MVIWELNMGSILFSICLGSVILCRKEKEGSIRLDDGGVVKIGSCVGGSAEMVCCCDGLV